MAKRIKEKKPETIREKLVGNILYYAGDEYETKEDYAELAMMSSEDLLDILISTLDYYYDQAQNN